MDEQIAEQTETPVADEWPSTTVEVRHGRKRRTGIMLVLLLPVAVAGFHIIRGIRAAGERHGRLFVFTKLYNAGTDFHFQSYKLEIITALTCSAAPLKLSPPFLVCSKEEHKR
jgi:hypothetical protein